MSRISISTAEFASLMKKIPLVKEEPLGVAVSGGVDSMALCYLLSRYCRDYKHKLTAFIVDHKLRPESTWEASQVAEVLSKLDVDSKVLQIQWNTREASKFLPSQTHAFPRTSQMELFARHHLNDQLETMVMRLARGSGIVGLASMETNSKFPVQRTIGALNMNVVRPMLKIHKSRIIETCKAANVQWFEDSTNESDQHKRNVVRMTLNTINQRYHGGQKEYEPISTEGLLRFVNHMEHHKRCVNFKVREILSRCVQFNSEVGFCVLDLPESLPRDHWFCQKHLAIRVITSLVRWVTCAEQPPILEPIARCYQHMIQSHTEPDRKSYSTQGMLLCPVIEKKKKHADHRRVFKKGSKQSWAFYRQPISKSNDKLVTNIIKDSEIILWDKRFFIGLELNKDFKHDDNNNKTYIVRRFKEADFPLVSRRLLKIKNSSSDEWRRYQHYRVRVHATARHNIPIVIRKDEDTESSGLELLISLPTLGISLAPDIANVWSKFRGQISEMT
ncbi:13334_t:CDS:2 [Acaulospora morrowiae]|uniref:tRNA(Ile)-lysidine synthetase n=1 Tax=Acaulospora morrowiae TaxID=94023 RepID=A0A9N8Z7V7_9GLOM|nr:13334_t:CDS:2 [Acaulospora morrowiae]